MQDVIGLNSSESLTLVLQTVALCVMGGSTDVGQPDLSAGVRRSLSFLAALLGGLPIRQFFLCTAPLSYIHCLACCPKGPFDLRADFVLLISKRSHDCTPAMQLCSSIASEINV